MPNFTERVHEDDVVRWFLYEGYNKVKVTVHNRSGSTLTNADIMGMPLQADSSVSGDYMFLLAGSESYCVGLLLSQKSFVTATLANLGTFISKALVRGPAIVDKAWIKTADVLGSAYTMATIVTALQGLNPPVVVNTEWPTTVTQTT